MLFKILFPVGFAASALYYFIAYFSQPVENTPPKVTITTPAKNSTFQWNSIVPYVIHVTDREDGNSEYNEIANNEVLLIVKYLPDSSQVKKYLLDRSKTSHESLVWMSTSTCFTCHAAKTKLIGPSFELIAQRYLVNSITIESLAKKIITGSSGTWGDLKMPPHPDLKIEQAREVVKWILKNNADPDQNYIAGIEGAFRTKEKPSKEPGKGVYILTASYTDHGIKGMPRSPGGKLGQHTLVLKND